LLLILGPILGLGGVLAGLWWARRNELKKQRLEYAKQQLSEFYSPILSLRQHILSLSSLRKRLGEVADAVYLSDNRGLHTREETAQALNGMTEFDNQQFRDVLLPMYKEMQKIFREKYWLATTEVQEHFYKLIEYIELWQRNLDKTIPGPVIAAMEVAEKKLHPLYQALEIEFQKRQRMLEAADTDADNPDWWVPVLARVKGWLPR
jgi:hypothetical protein